MGLKEILEICDPCILVIANAFGQKSMGHFNYYKHDGRKERGHDIVLRHGYNFRFNEILASIGLAQLTKYKSIQRYC